MPSPRNNSRKKFENFVLRLINTQPRRLVGAPVERVKSDEVGYLLGVLPRTFFFVFVLFGLPLALFAAPSVQITPTTQNINPGQKATVKIVTAGANKCTISGGVYNKNNIVMNGSILLSPTNTTTYIIECTSIDSSTTTKNAVVNIVQPRNAPTTSQGQNTQAQNPNSVNRSNPSRSQAPRVQYGNESAQKEANSICAAYSSYQSVYSPVSGGGGGSSVPVDLTQLRPYLISIDRNSQLTANEMRQADLIRFCRLIPNIAQASARLAENSAKQLKSIADSCIADENCLIDRVYKSDTEQALKRLDTFPIYGREIKKLVNDLIVNNEVKEKNIDVKDVEQCAKLRAQGRNPTYCILVPTKEDILKEEYLATKEEIEQNSRKLKGEFYQNNGVIGTRTCLKTKTGGDPTNVNWYDEDCVEYRIQPALVNQEVLRQITSLPYTQAFSPAAELGHDPSVGNISTRIRGGNLIDPDISANFGSISAGGANPAGGGNGGAFNVNGVTSIKSVEENYKKLVANVGVIVTLYEVAKVAYASSTSVCGVLPVTTRSQTLEKIESAKKSYTDYLEGLNQAWERASSSPRENHTDLITRVNFDIKDKYNQTLVNQVYDAVKSLLQACVTAAQSITPTS